MTTAKTAASRSKDNYFTELASIDVSEHIEKKGKFSYLSWAWAVDQLRKNDPEATWEVIRFDGLPYLKSECGYFVEVAVTCKGITLSQIHPVLDNNNRPIAQPNAFQINTSIQRCLVKAIALHGLGLYIYAGEDLPESAQPVKEEEADPSARLKAKFQLGTGNAEGFEAWMEKMKSKGMTFPQMDYILQEALNKKAEESKVS
ncbi:DUF1071 domain-containing protein [Paenibacillus aurantius]|uniref:DUF1071 domain-containing protein n=1 Tax=Paenibacillus aurantius TaxID=2918900 RepID=A0AA96RHC4_9BACL|nr:DUF1071 domain-containing protein [Paenibacillus aurantius]WNQ13887.1 DUF1071 domain-containing protein [Paenibacillus aurantius]